MSRESTDFLPRWLNLRWLFVMLGSVLLLHIVVFVNYSQQNSSVEFNVNRDVIARQIINFIQTVQNTPFDEKVQLVKALDIPNFKISIDSEPKWQEQFVNASLWQILKDISTQNPNIQLSYYLGPEQWLNISATIISRSVGLPTLLLSLEVTILLAFIFFLWMVYRFTEPWKKVTAAAERLGQDIHSAPLDLYGPRAAQVTANAINKMQQRIRDLIQARTQMLAAISHDLRTPITRLKLRAQYIQDEGLLQKITRDLDEMESMIAETLSFAREDNKNEKRVKFDLASLLCTICDDYVEAGHLVKYHGPVKGVAIQGGLVALKRVLTNLIENAVKYAHSADVNLQQSEQKLTVTIDDYGPGIEPELHEKVFQPFFRGEHSRSRETGGTGLGLAVARDIVQAHGGHIELQSRDPQGLRVLLHLPMTVG